MVKRCRRRLGIQTPPIAGTPSYDGAALDTVGTRGLAGPRTSIYARIDQLYGTIPAAPSIYEACQPDRRANTDSAALPSSPLEHAVNASTDSYERLRYNTMGKEAEYIIFMG